MRLICLGDSLTQGAFGGSFVAALRRLRPQDTILNAGRGGDTVLNLLRRVDEVTTAEPDHAFVMVGGNDAISYCQPKTRQYYRRTKGIDEGFVAPEAFASACRDLLTQLQLHGIVCSIGLPPAEANRSVAETLARYNALARDAADRLGVPALDLQALFMADIPPDRPELDMGTILTIGQRESSGWQDYEAARSAGGFHYTFDGLHLMPEAADHMARLIADFLFA